MFGLSLSIAEDEAKRNADDKARVFEIIKTLTPVGAVAYVTTGFKPSSVSKRHLFWLSSQRLHI